MKSQVLHTVWCNISGEPAGEIWHWYAKCGFSNSPRYLPRKMEQYQFSFTMAKVAVRQVLFEKSCSPRTAHQETHFIANLLFSYVKYHVHNVPILVCHTADSSPQTPTCITANIEPVVRRIRVTHESFVKQNIDSHRYERPSRIAK